MSRRLFDAQAQDSRRRLDRGEVELLSAIPFDHYRVELALVEKEWQKELEDAIWEANELTTDLELVILCDNDFEEQIRAFVAACSDHVKIIKSILPLQPGQKVTPDKFITFLRRELGERAPHIKIGYGSSGSFADLNRNRPGNINIDFIALPLSPQVHADDTRSVIENLGRQSDLVETAFSFSPLAISCPISLEAIFSFPCASS